MKNLIKYLAIGAILFSNSAGAMQTDLHENDFQTKETLQVASPEIQKFEKLMTAALEAKKLPYEDRTLVAVMREILVKLGCTEFAVILVNKLVSNDSTTSFTSLGLSIIFFVITADLFIHKKDPSAVALQNLAKYVATLDSEQKNNIRSLFKSKYATKLKEKIETEKDNKRQQIACGLATFIDTAVPLFIGCCYLALFFKAKKRTHEDEDQAQVWLNRGQQHTAMMAGEHRCLRNIRQVEARIAARATDGYVAAEWQDRLNLTGRQLQANQQYATNMAGLADDMAAAEITAARTINKESNVLLLIIIPAFIDALIVLYNHFHNSPDQQKSRALAKINTALKVGFQ